MTWLQTLWKAHVTAIILGVLLGLLLGPLFGVVSESVYGAYDEAYPVVEMHGDVQSTTVHDVVLHISGEKKRGCQPMRITAYTRDKNGNLQDANIQKLGVAERGLSRPLGPVDLGLWRIWPRDGADGVMVFVTHQCAGRSVITKVADVVLQ